MRGWSSSVAPALRVLLAQSEAYLIDRGRCPSRNLVNQRKESWAMTLSIKCSHTLLGQLGLFGSLVIFCGALWAQNPAPPFIPDVTGFSSNTTVAASTVATA